MKIELSPCPFCTCAAVELETVTDGDLVVDSSQVECPACLARGPEESTEERAIEAWNARGPAVAPHDRAPEPVGWFNPFSDYHGYQQVAKEFEGTPGTIPLYAQPPATPTVAGADDFLTEDQIKHMVDRFLGWKLPDNFNPDAGISFKRNFNEHTAYPMKHEPSGTNLFDATQANAMVRHMIKGLTVAGADKPKITCHAEGDRCLGCAHYRGEADQCEFAPQAGPAVAQHDRGTTPVAWVIPGDDNSREDGWLDAKAWRDGEFSRPLYATPTVAGADRAAVIEECAKAAEAQKKDFLSPEYASNQPFGSICERFACDEVAKAIRALAAVSGNERGGK